MNATATRPKRGPASAAPIPAPHLVPATKGQRSRPADPKQIRHMIQAALKEHGSPVMLIERAVLRRQYETFRRGLPRVRPFYAIKANPHPGVIRSFVGMDAGFDCASLAEIHQVLSLGARPDEVIFANTIKRKEEIQAAGQKGVKLMTFDNEPELSKIAKHCPGARVVLRLKVVNLGSQVALSLKFGADPEHAVPLLKLAAQLKLQPWGLSFHVGSQCTNANNYLSSLELCHGIFRETEAQGIKLRMLDIGGGFPIRHFERDTHPTFETMAQQLRPMMDRLFKRDVEVIAEPGRYLVGPAGTLVTRVVGRAIRNNLNYYYLDDGVYQDFSGIVFDHCKYEFRTLRRGEKFFSILAGPTCDSFDTLAIDVRLPEMDLDDVVYVRNIGAYSCASAVPNFNGFKPAKVVLV